MFTTAGIARRAASLKERRDAVAGARTGAGSDSRTSTTCERQASQSGFTRLTTKSIASVSVTAWAKRSQSLRIRPLFSHEGVADLAQQHDILWLGRGRGRFRAAHAVDPLHHEEDDEGEDHEVHQDVQDVAPRYHRDARLLDLGERVGDVGGDRRERDVVLREVQTAGELAHHRHDQVTYQRIDDLAEGRADDHADGQVDDIALHGELAEFRHHAHGALLLFNW